MDRRAESSALLVMDVQRGVVEHSVGDAGFLARLRQAVDTARAGGTVVIFVRVAFRTGHPEVSPRNRIFAAVASSAGISLDDGDDATQIHPAPEPTTWWWSRSG